MLYIWQMGITPKKGSWPPRFCAYHPSLGGPHGTHHGHDEKEPMKIGGTFSRCKAYSRAMFLGIYLQNMA